MAKAARMKKLRASAPKAEPVMPGLPPRDSVWSLRQSVETMRVNVTYMLTQLPAIDAGSARKARVTRALKACEVSLASDLLPGVDALQVQLSARSWAAAEIALVQAQARIKQELDRFHTMVTGLGEPSTRPGDDVLGVLVHESGANVMRAFQQFLSAAAMMVADCADRGGRHPIGAATSRGSISHR